MTSQPQAGQAQGAGMPVYAMPPPSSNPTNPFTGAATESTGLNTGNQPIYTPGKQKGTLPICTIYGPPTIQCTIALLGGIIPQTHILIEHTRVTTPRLAFDGCWCLLVCLYIVIKYRSSSHYACCCCVLWEKGGRVSEKKNMKCVCRVLYSCSILMPIYLSYFLHIPCCS